MPPAFILSQDQTLRFDGYELKIQPKRLSYLHTQVTDKQNKFVHIIMVNCVIQIDDHIIYVQDTNPPSMNLFLKLTLSNRSLKFCEKSKNLTEWGLYSAYYHMSNVKDKKNAKIFIFFLINFLTRINLKK